MHILCHIYLLPAYATSFFRLRMPFSLVLRGQALCDRLVVATASGTLSEEVVDDKTADREEEDKQEPCNLW
jgi:hypothetical protein